VKAPLDQDVPFDFNPTQVERVSNDEFLPTFDGSDRLMSLISQVVDAYWDQVAAPGVDAATTAAAEARLLTIQQRC
jgi:hypothetical protein